MRKENILLLSSIIFISITISSPLVAQNPLVDELIVSAYNGNTDEFLSILSKYRLDINSQDEIGLTPLLSAIIGNHIELASLIISKGANIMVKNWFKQPVNILMLSQNVSLKKILKLQPNPTKRRYVRNVTAEIFAA